MVKPFYVIALFVAMVTSLAVLWNINLSSPKVASYLSRCSPDTHQKASWVVALVFCLQGSGLLWSNCIWKSSACRHSLEIAGCCPTVFPLGFSSLCEAPTRPIRSAQGLSQKNWLWGSSGCQARALLLKNWSCYVSVYSWLIYVPAKGKGREHNLAGVKFLWV